MSEADSAEDRLDEIRSREYPEPSNIVFLNTASWGLVPRSAAEEVADLALRRNRPDGVEEEEFGRIQRRCRTAVGRLLDVPANEVALVPNTSYGVNLAAALVASGEPGTIVVSQGEFPANVLPWKALESRGFTVRVVPSDPLGRPDEERLLRAVEEPGVRALAVSSVQFSTGYRADLEPMGRACRRAEVLFCVDAIQSMGAVPFHPRVVHADVVACGGQKWLCSPWGSGFAWMRPELRERVTPPMVSWLAVDGSADMERVLDYSLDWRQDARKLELATNGLQDYLGLARACELFLEIGVDAVEGHLGRVLRPLVEWAVERRDITPITPTAEARRAGIFAFVPEDVESSVSALRARGVVFSVREGAVRLAPHVYTTVADMESVVGILDEA